MDVITVGETMAAFVPSETGPLRYVKDFSMRIAGAESNLAIGLAKLDCQAGWISRLGKDELGIYVRNAIRAEGVDTSCVVFDETHPTGIMFKERGTRDTGVYYYRSNSAASMMEMQDIPEEYLKKCRILFLTGITPVLSDSCRDLVWDLIRFAQEHGIMLGFDPNVRRKLWKSEDCSVMLRKMALEAQIVTLGLDEAKILFELEDPVKICRVLYETGKAEYIAVKNGSSGAWVSRRGMAEPVLIPPIPCHCIETIGAGDAFNAGFLKGILRGDSIEDCGRYGAVAGAMATECVGDIEGYPDWETIQNVLEDKTAVFR